MSLVVQWREAPDTRWGVREALRTLLTSAGGAAEAWRLGDAEITDALGDLARARGLLEQAEVALVREGLSRGLPSSSSWSERDWVTRAEGQRAPDPTIAHVSSVVRVSRAGTPMAGKHATTARQGICGVIGAFESGDLPLGKADQLVRFHGSVAPVADEGDLEGALETLTEGARDEVRPVGPEGRGRERVGGLTERQLASAISQTARLLRPEKEQEGEDERAKAARSLTKSPGPAGMTRYKVLLDEEGAAVIDAALAAMSGPVPGADGEPDLRSPSRRRADALVEIVRRGVCAPGEEPTCEKAQVIVTMGLDDLREQTAGAGVTFTGQVLAPSVVRRLACDAGIIPAVLGSEGEVLEMGRVVRFFTPAQRRAMWMRDQGCTYPGCTMPPQWCDAHHVDWWSHGGATDVSNGALLCQRHHTRVHSRDLTATITPTGVTWHL